MNFIKLDYIIYNTS